jgi:hypothetical protein
MVQFAELGQPVHMHCGNMTARILAIDSVNGRIALNGAVPVATSQSTQAADLAAPRITN